MNLVHRLARQLPLMAVLTALMLVGAGCSGPRTRERLSRVEYMSIWPHLRAAKAGTLAESFAHFRDNSSDVTFWDHLRMP